jgi:hypothetical protein
MYIVRDRMVVGFITTYATTKVVSSNLADAEVSLMQPYVVKFFSDLRQIDGFLRCPPPIKLTATI